MIGLRSLVETTHARTWIRDVDVRVKLVLLLATAALVVLIDSPWTLLAILVFVVVLYVFAGLPGAKLRLVVLIVMLTVWGTMLSQSLFYASVPRTPVLELISKDCPVLGNLTGGLFIYREGLFYGAVQSLRIVTMIGLGLLVCWTTDPGEFLSPLVRIRVPYGVAFMTVTAMRFLPAVVAEAAVVLRARRMKGYHRRRDWLRPWRRISQVFKPVFANSIRRSRALALSVESRAFKATGRRTRHGASRLSKPGVAAISAVVLVVLSVASAKLLHWLFMEEVLYSESLWWLYEVVRTCL